MTIDVFEIVQMVLDVIKTMDDFSISLGSFTFSLWDMVVAMGITRTISYISGLRTFNHAGTVTDWDEEDMRDFRKWYADMDF